MQLQFDNRHQPTKVVVVLDDGEYPYVCCAAELVDADTLDAIESHRVATASEAEEFLGRIDDRQADATG